MTLILEEDIRQLKRLDDETSSRIIPKAGKSKLEDLLVEIVEASSLEELSTYNRYETRTYNITTDDGWRLNLKRYMPKRIILESPVLLLHGFCQDSRMWEIKYAEYLAKHGVEVWIGNFRGRYGTEYIGNGNSNVWDLDAFIEHDLPALIYKVLKISKCERLFLVGFSLGGKVCYSYLSINQKEQEKIKGMTTIAAPARLEKINPDLMNLEMIRRLYDFSRHIFRQDTIPLPRLAELLHTRKLHENRWIVAIASSLGLSDLIANYPNMLYNPENVEPEDISRVFHELNPVSAELVRQLRQGILGVRIDKKGVVEDRYSRIAVPCAVFSGSRDLLCYPASVFPFYNDVKENNDFNMYHGFRGCGHLDLTMGINAYKGVLPMNLLWMLCVENELRGLFDFINKYTNNIAYGRHQFERLA